MAPRRGGSLDYTTASLPTEPTTPINWLFGHPYRSVYGYLYPKNLLVTTSILTFFFLLLLLLFLRHRRHHHLQRWWWHRLLTFSVLLLLLAELLLLARSALLFTESPVPLSFKVEYTFQRVLGRMGELGLLAAIIAVVIRKNITYPPSSTTPEPPTAASHFHAEKESARFPDAPRIIKLFKLALYALWTICGALLIAYTTYAFIFDGQAGASRKRLDEWVLTDRDFGVVMTRGMAWNVKSEDYYGGDFPGVKVLEKMLRWPKWAESEEARRTFIDWRGTQIKLGVAMDVLVLVTILVAMGAGLVRWRWRRQVGERAILRSAFCALVFLLFLAILHLVTSAHFILPNFRTLTSATKWEKFTLAYEIEVQDIVSTNSPYRPSAWFEDYRHPVSQWPVIEIVLEGVGRVLTAYVLLAVVRRTLYPQEDDDGDGEGDMMEVVVMRDERMVGAPSGGPPVFIAGNYVGDRVLQTDEFGGRIWVRNT
ncbi:hypothetical protein EX30DRAFT_343140 [Ascodesmis nigricans]|uniref:Uncharacterized protein n=1 Tax=Ascodesmis nigricans TaxID=341454 RepID=A0A4S2MNG7_9PEZI|nr:hypothetical protein EX30DRAFT_343140 [Ascodesmis nigricans]